MKQKFLTVISIILLAAVVAPNFAYAFSTDVLDNPTYMQSADGFTYKEVSVSENGFTRKLYYGEYNATASDSKYEWVLHSVRSGSTTTLTTVRDIAEDYEETTGRKVLFASNGDFFNTTGANVESYVVDGIVISKGSFSTKHCVGFDNNGKIAIGRMTEVSTRLALYSDGERRLFEIENFNSAPTSGIAIYNTAGSYTLENVGVMIVKTDSATLTNYPVWGTDYTMTQSGVKESVTFTLKSGQFAVVYTAQDEQTFASHTFGQQVDMVEIPAGDFEGCTYVIGGYDILVNNGTVGSSFHTDNSGNVNRARTLIGFREDGTCFVCMVDEIGGSTGITVTKEAELASALGADYALELDGGGSTTSVVRIDDELTVRNSPSDGSERKVSNAVLLVEKQAESDDSADEPEVGEITFEKTSAMSGDAPSLDGLLDGNVLTLPQNTFSRGGYVFDGWQIDGEIYSPGDKVTVPEEGLTVSAVWKADSSGHLTTDPDYRDLYIGLAVCGVVAIVSAVVAVVIFSKKRRQK